MTTSEKVRESSERRESGSFFFDLIRCVLLWTSVVILTSICALLVLICFPFVYVIDRQRHFLHGIGTLWTRAILFCNPWWKFRVVGQHNLIKKGKAAVYVSNHQSQADILAIYALGTRFRWLGKASLFKIPVLGWAMLAIGYVPVIRGNKRSSEKCMERSAEHLRMGTPMVFFAEGTRSKTGQLGEFKTGAFRLAKQLNVPIIPITIQGCSDLLPKNTYFPRDAQVKITVHKPISVEDITLENLVEKARNVIASELPEHLR